MSTVLKIDGEVESPIAFSFEQLSELDGDHLVLDLSRLGLRHGGDAVRLESLLEQTGCKPSARYLGLHATADNYHVSIPLDLVRDTALLVFRREGEPLDAKAGGPFVRFFIPNHVACQSGEIDACANIKFVDHIEVLSAKGPDSRVPASGSET